jgi:CHAT domain
MSGVSADQTGSPGLDRIQAALDRGDVGEARKALLELTPQERKLLSAEIGEPAVRRAQGTAARGPRRAKAGRVLVLPGVMGSMLDVTDPGGDTDRVWTNYARLIAGRFADLALTPAGDPAVPGTQVRAAGVHHGSYLPLLIELDARWEVRPFPYDWREPLDRTAARLDAEVRAFGAGGPVHIVAHSMGGLVSRTFAALFAETWAAMDDPETRGRGGRLVMLGTPNRGSFDMARALVGADPLVRRLALADIPHDLDEVLAIIATFPGLAHMLPSPTAAIPGSAHAKLYDEATWGKHPILQGILDAARAGHTRLETTVDPERLVYVAGYDRPTPYGVRVDGPGRLSFKETLNGDGRVPHDLGLLDGVATYWVDAAHGDLAKSDAVLDAIGDLLQRGATDRLSTTRPRSRRAERSTWVRAGRMRAADIAGDAEVAAISGVARGRGTGARARPTPEEAVRLDGLVLGDYLGLSSELPADSPPPVRPSTRGKGGPPTLLPVDVHWGDVTLVKADVYVAGHYIGVIPQNAELALDRVVSGIAREVRRDEVDRSKLVITQQALRGMFRGALGEISFFPWGYRADRGKLVAIAGMGHPGTYSVQAQRRLVRELVLAVGSLPTVQDVAAVLIGSGEGTLSIPEAIRGLVEGIGDALVDSDRHAAPMSRLIIAERSRQRAIEIHAALVAAALAVEKEAETDPEGVPIGFQVGEAPIASAGGEVSAQEALALLVDAGLRAARRPASSTGRALAALIGQIPTTDGLRKEVLEGISWAAQGAPAPKPGQGLPRFLVAPRPGESGGDLPVRISFWQDDRSVRVAAIHSSATVPERVLRVQPKMVGDLVDRLTDPAPDRVGRLSDFLARVLIPPDFRDLLRSGPFVFEVDRPMARVQWELLAYEQGGANDEEPLAVRTPLARQLRTTYSPPPMPPARPGRALRALVIGDPGDPAEELDLPGARHEALAVSRLLRDRLGEENVDTRIGAPSVPRTGDLRDIPPADWLDVLDLLTKGGYDLVHYAGHGDFDPVDATRGGWLFAGGLITSGEIERLDEVPAIVVANACLSSRTAQTETTEAALLPSIADEFFKLGVRNYIGTAWEVNDLGAERFATTFYGALLPGPGGGKSFGDAIVDARMELWKSRDQFGALWAAYQHYGDPASEAALPPLE